MWAACPNLRYDDMLAQTRWEKALARLVIKIVVSEADVATFCTQDCHWSCLVPLLWLLGDQFGRLVASTLALRGIIFVPWDGPEEEFNGFRYHFGHPF